MHVTQASQDVSRIAETAEGFSITQRELTEGTHNSSLFSYVSVAPCQQISCVCEVRCWKLPLEEPEDVEP